MLLALAIAVAACGGSTPDATTSSSSPAGEADESRTIGEVRDSRYSPIGEALGRASIDDDELAEQEREVQLAIRECMLLNGFEYDIVDTAERAQFAGGIDDSMTELEFAKTFGFGIATRFENRLGAVSQRQTGTNPNSERLAGMGETEAQAYLEALQGERPFEGADRDPETGQPLDPETGEPVDLQEFLRNFEPSGCAAEANEAVFGTAARRAGPRGNGQNAIDDDLRTGIQDMQASIDADPRVVTANREWSACMTEAGHAYNTPDQMREQLTASMRPIEEAVLGTPQERAAQRQAIANADLDAMTEEQRTAFLEAATAAPAIDAETQLLLEEIERSEIAAAMANYECSKDIDSAYEEVRIEYEERFVAENQAALDAAAAIGN